MTTAPLRIATSTPTLPVDAKTGLTLPLSKSRAWQASDRLPLVSGAIATIKLTRGLKATIDAEDAERIGAHVWHAHVCAGGTYARTWVRDGAGKRIGLLMHTAVSGFELTDHIDGNGLNNMKANLRPASRAENNRNSSAQRNNKSGFKGVSQAPSGRWRARIACDGKQMVIGTFDTAEEAHAAYRNWSERLHGKFGRSA